MDVPYVIGLDVGTSSVKAALFGPDGPARNIARRRIDTTIGHGATATQDPAQIEEAVFSALGEVVRTSTVPIAAVSISTAMHGLVGIGHDGSTRTPLMTWADGRAATIVQTWKASGEADFVHARTGVPLHPMAPVAKIAWFARNEPETAASIMTWLDLKALVIAWLTGEAVTDVSSASGWGLMDLRGHDWDPKAVELSGADATTLPRIVSTTTALPMHHQGAARCGLTPGTPVVAGAGDGPAANIGVGAIGAGVAALSLGTSGAVRVVVDRVPDRIDPALFCYALDEGRWVIGAAVSNGGNIVDWLAGTFGQSSRELGDLAVHDILEQAASAPPGSDGLVMVPYLWNERAPLWDPALPGAYLGLRARHTRAHLARAAIEGVCVGLGAVVDTVAQAGPVETIRATGTTLTHPLWRDVLAAAVGFPVTVTSAEAGSALGVAALGLVALGVTDDLQVARNLLGFDDTETDHTIVVSPELRAAALATRRSVGELVDQLGDVAGAFAC